MNELQLALRTAHFGKMELSGYIYDHYLKEKHPDIDVGYYCDFVMQRMVIYLRRNNCAASFELGPYDLEMLDEEYFKQAIELTIEKLEQEEGL